jgi:hypothetical protein
MPIAMAITRAGTPRIWRPPAPCGLIGGCDTGTELDNDQAFRVAPLAWANRWESIRWPRRELGTWPLGPDASLGFSARGPAR